MSRTVAPIALFISLLIALPAFSQEWNRHVLDYEAGENIGEYCDLAVRGGDIVVSYYREEAGVNGYLKIAWYDGTDWTLSIVDDSGISDGKHSSIAFDPADGNPAIAYRSYGGTNYFMKYAKYDGAAWDIEPIPLPGGVTNAEAARGRALAFSADGTPYLTWFSSGTADLYVSHRESDVWVHDLVEDDGYLGPAASLIFDGAFDPWVIYFHNSGSMDKLEYAHHDGVWNFGEVYGPGNNDGEYNSIAYYAATDQLISAFKEGVYIKTYEWDSGSSSWVRFGTATAPGNLGLNTYNSCAFDNTGMYALAWFNDNDNSLRYARWTGSSWHRAAVEATRDVGRYCALGFAAGEVPVIAAYDADDEALVLYVYGDLPTGTGVATAEQSSFSPVVCRAWPNPFGPAVNGDGITIRFSLPEDRPASLRIYDIRGRLVRNLLPERTMAGGGHSVSWDGNGESGHPLSSGVYFYRLDAGNETSIHRVLLLK